MCHVLWAANYRLCSKRCMQFVNLSNIIGAGQDTAHRAPKKYKTILADPPWQYRSKGSPCLPEKQPKTCLVVNSCTSNNNRRRNAICHWTLDVDICTYDTECGEKWEFLEGTPHENGVVFCHKCGKRASVNRRRAADVRGKK